jgi:hypothetical protein
VVVERDVKPDNSLLLFGHIVSEHGTSAEAFVEALHKERGRELERRPSSDDSFQKQARAEKDEFLRSLQGTDRDLTRER